MIEWFLTAPLLAVAALLGGGFKWVWDRVAKARATREERIEAREHEFVEGLKARIDVLEARDRQRERENVALRLAFELVAAEVRRTDPGNEALKRAESYLATAFGDPVKTPADLIALLARLDGDPK